ncbi:MAG: hypothetical protein ACRDCJ_00540 [Metamycoplasmataceae bacterium]
MLEKLRKRLDFELLDCKFSRKDNLDFLNIEIDYSTLAEIEEKSKIISKILDEIDKSDKEYYLNIYSPGAEREIKFQNLENYINKNIKITLKNQQLNNTIFDGELLEINEDSLKLKVNMKGCIRKIDFQILNIKKINKSIKVSKTKKGIKQNEESN